MGLKVCKFGGTSLADADQVRKMADIVLSDPDRRVVVVSAPGKRDKRDDKVTDLLIACAEAYQHRGEAAAEVARVVDRFGGIVRGLGLPDRLAQEVEGDLLQRMDLLAGAVRKERLTESLKAAGEDNCARIVAAYLTSLGAEASYVDPKDAGMLLSDDHGNARVLNESYRRLASLKGRAGVSVFPGFFGYTLGGDVVTFPRDGSDITGAVLAAAVGASVYENFKDVDSVFAANPNVVDDPEAIGSLTYREMRELAYAGFSVLHEDALGPVYKHGIPVSIRNTNNPGAKGTMITHSRERGGGPVVGIAGEGGFCSLNISKFMMNHELGFGRKVLQMLEDEGISFDHIPSGIDNLSIIFKEGQLDPGKEDRIARYLHGELKVDTAAFDKGKAMVMIVGEGMTRTVGTAKRATSALAGAGINIEVIDQGASEESLMFGVRQEDADGAVRALYAEFFPRA